MRKRRIWKRLRSFGRQVDFRADRRDLGKIPTAEIRTYLGTDVNFKVYDREKYTKFLFSSGVSTVSSFEENVTIVYENV